MRGLTAERGGSMGQRAPATAGILLFRFLFAEIACGEEPAMINKLDSDPDTNDARKQASRQSGPNTPRCEEQKNFIFVKNQHFRDTYPCGL